MFRFIGNFILFGIIFYLIYLFFPDAFTKLFEWAQELHHWFLGLFNQSSAAAMGGTPPVNHP